jgi:RimJ/RimL family protein N-acetyltransferase
MDALHTGRLTLREFDEARDAEFILRLLNDPAFIENIADKGVRTLEDAREYIRAGPAASYAKNGFGLWHVGLRGPAPASLGMCGLIKRDILEDIDLGYAFLPEHRGRGYALEAAAAALQFAQERLRAARVVAVVSPGNAPSIRLLKKLGFGYERSVRMAADEDEIELYALDFRGRR